MRSPAMPSTRTWTVAAAVVAVGLLLRWWVLRSTFGVLNADESYSGLQSMGVIRDGRFPIVMDGQSYTAAIEAYVFSPLLVFVVGSIAVLKWSFVSVWLAVLFATFGAARHIAGRRAAAFAGRLGRTGLARPRRYVFRSNGVSRSH